MHTWTPPDGKSHHQFDHILIDRRRQSSVLDVCSFRGADCDSDHYLVVENIREILEVNKQASQTLDGEKFNVRVLKNWRLRKNTRLRF